MPITPPTPVVRTGTWILKSLAPQDPTGDAALSASPNGAASIDVVSPPPRAGTVSCVFPLSGALYLDGSSTPIPGSDVPTGFTIAVDDEDYTLHVFEALVSGCSIHLEHPHFALDETLLDPTLSGEPNGDKFIALTGLTALALLTAEGSTALVTMVNDGSTFAVNSVLFGNAAPPLGFTYNGTYTAPGWWWVVGHPAPDAGPEGEGHLVPMVDACGNRQDEAPFFRTGEDPGPPWERLDPDDEAAHPTPVVLAVTPNHGAIAGGTPVTITGSGFGYGATVDFDGVPATDVVALTQTEITCVTPAHATGAADVIVTNVDGVHS